MVGRTPKIARVLAVAAALAAACASAHGALADAPSDRFAAAVAQITAEPYQPDYVPAGTDGAFDTLVPNTAPAEDYTTGSIPGDPDYPAWPAAFRQVLFASADGAPLFGMLALHPGSHPGVVVVHGFNTHGYASVIRWAALLYARGYDVIAADQRDFFFEAQAGYGYPAWLQTFGWKESEDVLAAGRHLAAQPGVGAVGVVGFSEGAQNTVLALAQDASRVFSAGLTFSGPADQNTQIASNPAATDALVALVTPSETTACGALADAAGYYATTGFDILGHETAMHAQQQVRVPLLNFYTADDSLVPSFEAEMMAAYESGNDLQQTIELQRGEHAYFFDRWWQQRALLLYFRAMLPGASHDATIGAGASVNQTPGGSPASAQTVPIGPTSRAWADAQRPPYVCDPSQGTPP
jgi:predicted alpha/beta-fold hydrolase